MLYQACDACECDTDVVWKADVYKIRTFYIVWVYFGADQSDHHFANMRFEV